MCAKGGYRKKRFKRAASAFGLALLVLLLHTPAWSEPPAFAELLTDVAIQRSHLEALEAEYVFPLGKSESEPGDPGNTPNLMRETVFYRAPGHIRLNLSWPDREEVFLAANLKTLVMVGDQATDTPWPQPFLLYRLLVESEADNIRRLLEAFDFDLNKIFLSPGGDYYILGAVPGDTGPPQVWFDRETLALARLILPPAGVRPGYDVTLSDYRRHESRTNWPHRLLVKSSSAPETLLTLSALRINPQIEQEPIDLEEIRRTVAPPPEPATHRNPELIEIRKMMEWLEKKLE